jgi:hypothetical protein
MYDFERAIITKKPTIPFASGLYNIKVSIA